jgi:hypothetical protein
MKKLLLLASCLLLVLACQKGVNDLVVNSDLPLGTGASNLPTVTATNPAPYAEILDQDGSKSGIQGKIEITFSDYMDAATVTNPANIKLLKTNLPTQEIGGITTEYFQEIRKLYIYIADVPDSGVYYLRLVTGGMTNTYGSPLDFDGDNMADGSPYDDVLIPYYTTPLLDSFVVPNQPTISSFFPDTQAVNNLLPTITINFNPTFPMDTFTLNANNIKLANEAGNDQPLTLVSRNVNQVILRPTSNLVNATNYRITVKCDNIKRLGDSQTPDYYLKLDGNLDGPAASEPDLQSIFRVDDPALPPTCNVTAIGTSGALFTFSRLIDEATISTATIAVYDNSGYVPGQFRIYNDAANTYTMIDYYFQRTIGAGRHGWISKDLKATNGYKFDGNGNGIGGEPWDDLSDPF